MLQLVPLDMGTRLAQVELACCRITGGLLGVPCKRRGGLLAIATWGTGAATSCKLAAIAAVA